MVDPLDRDLRIVREDLRKDRERVGMPRGRRLRIIGACLEPGVDEHDPPRTAALPKVVAGDRTAVRPADEHWSVEFERLGDGPHVRSPDVGVLVPGTRAVGAAGPTVVGSD
jgi:hypothetical protein